MTQTKFRTFRGGGLALVQWELPLQPKSRDHKRQPTQNDTPTELGPQQYYETKLKGTRG